MRRLLLPALAALAVQAAGPAHAQRSDGDEERTKQELELKLPAHPKAGELIEFSVSGGTGFRFFIDPGSLAPGSDGVVRYTLVARSPAGVSNISYEGIRCATNSYKVFALGNDGHWSVRPSDWREINSRSVQRWHGELRSFYFCPRGRIISSADEGVDALRRGGHPASSLADRAQ